MILGQCFLRNKSVIKVWLYGIWLQPSKWTDCCHHVIDTALRDVFLLSCCPKQRLLSLCIKLYLYSSNGPLMVTWLSFWFISYFYMHIFPFCRLEVLLCKSGVYVGYQHPMEPVVSTLHEVWRAAILHNIWHIKAFRVYFTKRYDGFLIPKQLLSYCLLHVCFVLKLHVLLWIYLWFLMKFRRDFEDKRPRFLQKKKKR